jgi:hypothetical protein
MGSVLEMAASKAISKPAHAFLMGIAITLLYAGPLLAWIVVRLRGASVPSKKFKMGFLTGAAGFYAALLSLYFCLAGGIH